MVFDFFNGGELYHYLSEGGKFTEDRARFYAAEIVMALGYLHDHGIVYRDLKPENLILDSAGHIRVTDFGLSKEGVEGDTITSVCGTPEYLAPEIIRRQAYGAAVDWWSLGTLLYEMIAGLPPFYDRNRPMMYRKILEAPLEFPADMSPEACDLISRMLARDPHARLGYGGSSEIKAHAFFRAYDWEKLYRREMAPPWTPAVASETDTHNIASEFTNEPPGVTPSPVGSRLRDVMGGSEEPPAFAGEEARCALLLLLPSGQPLTDPLLPHTTPSLTPLSPRRHDARVHLLARLCAGRPDVARVAVGGGGGRGALEGWLSAAARGRRRRRRRRGRGRGRAREPQRLHCQLCALWQRGRLRGRRRFRGEAIVAPAPWRGSGGGAGGLWSARARARALSHHYIYH